MSKNNIGSNPNIKDFTRLRDEIKEKIASALKEVEDPNETTPPAVNAEPVEENAGGTNAGAGEQNKDTDGAETVDDTEKNKDLGITSTPVEDGNAKDEAEENAAKTAKRAERILNIVSELRKTSSKKKAAAEEEMADKETEAKKTETEGKDKKTETGDKEKKTETEDKEATVKELLDSLDIHSIYKLAAVVLSTDNLTKAVNEELDRFMDKQAARNIIEDSLMFAQEYETVMSKQAEFLDSLNTMVKAASEDEKAEIEKIRKVHKHSLSQLSSDEEKVAYMDGAADAATVMDNNNEVPMPEEDAEPTDEEIIAVVEEMVANGELPPEDGDALITELAGGNAESEEDALDEETLAALAAADGSANAAAPMQ